jgi:hypothetical protein
MNNAGGGGKGRVAVFCENLRKKSKALGRARKSATENSFYKDQGPQHDKIQANLKNPRNIHDA